MQSADCILSPMQSADCAGSQIACNIANVMPIFKKNSKSLPNNYRPASLLPIISKIMEHIINKALTNFLEKHSVLSNRQFGFRSGLGTSDCSSPYTTNGAVQPTRVALLGFSPLTLPGPLTRYPIGAFFTRPPGMACGDTSTVGWKAT